MERKMMNERINEKEDGWNESKGMEEMNGMK